ncbi:MAG: hypothetical protein ACJ8F7_17615 [Gemmataceae bacterium]
MTAFERLPEAIHRTDPYFVPPFPGSVVKIFSPTSPYQRHGELLAFLARDKSGQPVGRIAAIVNGGHNAYYNDRVAFFGYFDFIDDPAVSRALFDHARQALKEKGFDTLRGPYNPTVNDEVGLLVDGFDSSPFIMMPYNPRYYLAHYEALGLPRARDLYAYLIDHGQPPDRILKICERVRRMTGLTLRPINLKRLDDELKIIQKLYNETLDRNWGFVPLSLDDLQFAANDLKSIVDPEMVIIAERGGAPVGFSMTLPNINEILYRTRGRSTLMRFLIFVWGLKVKRPKGARLAVLGVLPEFRGTGVPALFFAESLIRGSRKFTSGELSWVEETNREIIKGIDMMRARQYKTYRLFELPL